jgi:hypothetical protein
MSRYKLAAQILEYRLNIIGGECVPHEYGILDTGRNNTTTIYFKLSTWNPYTVVLMKTRVTANQIAAQ